MTKSNIFTLTPQEVNCLFSNLADQTNCVLWICALDYSQQLYLSPSFERIWQLEPELIYEHQHLLQNTVIQEDLNTTLTQIETQQHAIKHGSLAIPEQTLLYRIHRADGETRFIKDRSFVVNNKHGQPAALAGVGYDISADEWLSCQAKQRDIGQNIPHLETDFVQIIEKACTPKVQLAKPKLTLGQSMTIHVDGKNFLISAREMQCLIWIFQGATTKQTAKKLAISPRTVETYIEQLKIKFDCRSKLALLAKFANHPLLAQLANS